MTTLFALVLSAWLPIATPFATGAADTLAEIRDLYGSAHYEGALAKIEQITDGSSLAVSDIHAIRRYKALCLIALNRTEDARRVAEEIVRAEPLTGADASDPPRLRDLIQDVRERVLPDLVRERYGRGRARLEQKAYAEAASDFEFVVSALDDLGFAGGGGPELADLSLVAKGALDVIRLAAAAAAPAGIASQRSAGTAGSTSAAPADVVAPVVIQQRVPPWPSSLQPFLAQARAGLVEVIVGVDGRVASAKIVTSIHPVYDSLLLSAAKTWRYRPALLNGVPVQHSKLINVTVSTPRPANSR